MTKSKDGWLSVRKATIERRDARIAALRDECDRLRVALGRIEKNLPHARARIDGLLVMARHYGDKEMIEALEVVKKHDLSPPTLDDMDG